MSRFVFYWNFLLKLSVCHKHRILCRVNARRCSLKKKSIFSTSIWNHYLKIIPEFALFSFEFQSAKSFELSLLLQSLMCVWFACCVWQGDFTRTGERKLAGVMKDGVNSANRYYLNRFRDAYRQAVIGKSTISTKLSCGIYKRLLNHIGFIFLTDCFFLLLKSTMSG